MKLKFFFLAIVVLPFFVSCSVSYKLKNNYSVDTTIETATSYDEVWNKVVDFFAVQNLAITVLEKDSGLIAASNVSVNPFLITIEDKNGIPLDKSAWFVLPFIPRFASAEGTCSFNVRVQKSQDGTTIVSVNTGHFVGRRTTKGGILVLPYTDEKPVKGSSTGNFEKDLLDLFR